ncbi:hypothetical protein PIB30_095745, partial [Stylosanthes scabra]|nr:hypothetical protein [Stylosanthes scabra]
SFASQDESQEGTSSIKREGEAHHTTNTKVPENSRIPPSPPQNSPKSMLKPSKLLVLALAADALNPHMKAVENT